MVFTNYSLTLELQQYLNNNEKLIWTGQPKKGIVFTKDDISSIPFSLLWCGIVIFWVVIASQASIFFAMIGIPFLVIGLILVFGRFIIDAKQRENTIYGLTDDRVIIKSGVFKKSIKFLNVSTLSHIQYDEKSDGSGTIIIGPIYPWKWWSWGNGMNWWPGITPPPSLDLIEDVRSVYNKIIEIQKRV